jgi:hypothetical protein
MHRLMNMNLTDDMFAINKSTGLQHYCLLHTFQFISNFSTYLSTLYKLAIESDINPLNLELNPIC